MNEILIRRRNRLLLPTPAETTRRALLDAVATAHDGRALRLERATTSAVAAVAKNLEALGYALSPALLTALGAGSLDELTRFYRDVSPILRVLRGADRRYQPMYPNFPDSVMEASAATLYLNALIHYWSGGRLLPAEEIRARLPLLDRIDLTPLDLGSADELGAIFTELASANTSLSAADLADVDALIAHFGDAIAAYLPARLPQRETRALIGARLFQATALSEDVYAAWFTSATDVLRLAAALSDGDASLAAPTRFRLSRPARHLVAALLDRIATPEVDLARYREPWKRLAHALHIGTLAARYPHAAGVLAQIRADAPLVTPAGTIETALEAGNTAAALAVLVDRPGDLARRLDHLLRLDVASAAAAMAAFAAVAPRIATPLLLGLRAHFGARPAQSPVRVVFPKGQTAVAKLLPNELPALPETICARVVEIASATLRERFSALPSLGRVYIDPLLAACPTPHGGRSAASGLRTMARGTRLPLAEGGVARFFIYWRNQDSASPRDGDGRVDLDLSSACFDADFAPRGDIALPLTQLAPTNGVLRD